MTILKKWKEDPDKLREEGEPVDWFPTTQDECLASTEGAGYWLADSVLHLLAKGVEVFTPFAEYKKGN